MKKFVSLFLVLVTFCTMKVSALEPEAERFRSAIKSFLQEEGFHATIDDDGSLNFKKEGVAYWMFFSGDSPVYVGFYRAGTGIEDSDYDKVLFAVNAANCEYRCGKAMVTEDKSLVSYTVQSYCYAPEDFKYAFYKYLNVLQDIRDKVIEVYNDDSVSSSSTPVTFQSADVRIEKDNGDAVTDWGQTIYSYRTRYLTPRIKVNCTKAGTYTFNIKMFNADGKLTTSSDSPSGYSYDSSRTLTKGENTVKFQGWGSDTAGHWKAGNYRFEFYLGDKYLGSKSFTIK